MAKSGTQQMSFSSVPKHAEQEGDFVTFVPANGLKPRQRRHIKRNDGHQNELKECLNDEGYFTNKMVMKEPVSMKTYKQDQLV